MKNNYKILHFENDKDFVGTYGKSFEVNGFRYKNYDIVPSRKEELISLVLSEKPDLIFTKVNMPGLDGYTISKILRNNKQTRHISVMLLDDSHDEKKYIDSGLRGGWHKSDTNPENFPERIKRLFEREEEDEIGSDIKPEEKLRPTKNKPAREVGEYPEWVRIVFPFVLWGIIFWAIVGSLPPGSGKALVGILVIGCFIVHIEWMAKNNK